MYFIRARKSRVRMDGGKVMCLGVERLGLGMVGLSNRDKMGRF